MNDRIPTAVTAALVGKMAEAVTARGQTLLQSPNLLAVRHELRDALDHLEACLLDGRFHLLADEDTASLEEVRDTIAKVLWVQQTRIDVATKARPAPQDTWNARRRRKGGRVEVKLQWRPIFGRRAAAEKRFERAVQHWLQLMAKESKGFKFQQERL